MSQKCKACIHPKRAYINRMLMNPKNTLREISRRYGVTIPALGRHKKHIATAIVEAKQNGDIKEVKQAYEQFLELQADAAGNYKTSKGHLKIAWFRERRALLAEAYRLGELAQKQQDKAEFKDVTPGVMEIIDTHHKLKEDRENEEGKTTNAE